MSANLMNKFDWMETSEFSLYGEIPIDIWGEASRCQWYGETTIPKASARLEATIYTHDEKEHNYVWWTWNVCLCVGDEKRVLLGTNSTDYDIDHAKAWADYFANSFSMTMLYQLISNMGAEVRH